MDDLQRLLITEAVRETVFRAAAAADANDPVAFSNLFSEDAVLQRPTGAPLQGRAAILQAYQARPADRITRHVVTNFIVEVDDADHARGRSLVLLWGGSLAAADGPQGRPADARQLLGEFDDAYVRTAEGWRIARRAARFVLHHGG